MTETTLAGTESGLWSDVASVVGPATDDGWDIDIDALRARHQPTTSTKWVPRWSVVDEGKKNGPSEIYRVTQTVKSVDLTLIAPPKGTPAIREMLIHKLPAGGRGDGWQTYMEPCWDFTADPMMGRGPCPVCEYASGGNALPESDDALQTHILVNALVNQRTRVVVLHTESLRLPLVDSLTDIIDVWRQGGGVQARVMAPEKKGKPFRMTFGEAVEVYERQPRHDLRTLRGRSYADSMKSWRRTLEQWQVARERSTTSVK